MQTYGRDLYESIGETKVAGINRGFSPTREETDLSWSRSIGSIRGWRDISFASEKKKKRIFIERKEATVFSSRFFDKGNREGTRILRTRVM